MSNTAEYKGNVYELNKLYKCVKTHRNGLLISFDELKQYPFVIQMKEEHGTTTVPCQLLVEIDAELGTITKAPVKLIDGEAYQFQLEVGDFRLGYWKESRNSFFDSLIYANKICGKSEASDIQHLTVGEK